MGHVDRLCSQEDFRKSRRSRLRWGPSCTTSSTRSTCSTLRKLCNTTRQITLTLSCGRWMNSTPRVECKGAVKCDSHLVALLNSVGATTVQGIHTWILELCA